MLAITDSSNDGVNNNPNDFQRDGSLAQAPNEINSVARSGRITVKPKRFLQTTFLGLLSIQIGQSTCSDSHHTRNTSIFNAQIDHNCMINKLPDEKFNEIHPFSYVASKANDDVLHYYQAMQSDDADSFREVMGIEIESFKEEKIFDIIPIRNKPSNESLAPFFWSFKRKRNPMGELIKH